MHMIGYLQAFSVPYLVEGKRKGLRAAKGGIGCSLKSVVTRWALRSRCYRQLDPNGLSAHNMYESTATLMRAQVDRLLPIGH